MTLSDFLTEEMSRLERFAIMWRTENKKSPQDFPDEMEPGEWGEQWLAFEG